MGFVPPGCIPRFRAVGRASPTLHTRAYGGHVARGITGNYESDFLLNTKIYKLV